MNESAPVAPLANERRAAAPIAPFRDLALASRDTGTRCRHDEPERRLLHRITKAPIIIPIIISLRIILTLTAGAPCCGWPQYVHRRRETFASVVTKVTHGALPDAINSVIATFVEFPGGSYEYAAA